MPANSTTPNRKAQLHLETAVPDSEVTTTDLAALKVLTEFLRLRAAVRALVAKTGAKGSIVGDANDREPRYRQ